MVPHIHDLTDDALELIFAKLACRDLWVACATCRRWRCRILEKKTEYLRKMRCIVYGICFKENTVIGRDFKHFSRLVAHEQDTVTRAASYRSYFMKWHDYSLDCCRLHCPVSLKHTVDSNKYIGGFYGGTRFECLGG